MSGGGNTPRLRANTFLILLLRAAKDEVGSARSFDDERKGLTRTSLFTDLVKVAQPEHTPYAAGTLTSNLANFIRGTASNRSIYFPFMTDEFCEEVKNQWERSFDDVASRMYTFCFKYLKADNEWERGRLVGGLIDLIHDDDSIPDDAFFLIGERRAQKSDILSQTTFNLAIFLASVWSYILISKPDFTEGVDTASSWLKPSVPGVPLQVGTDYGNEWAKKITVSAEHPKEVLADTVEDTYDTPVNPGQGTEGPTADEQVSDEAETLNTPPLEYQTTVSGERVYSQRAEKIYNIEHIENFYG